VTQGKPNFDTKDSLTLKGMAILAISFHNYFHLLSRVHENEFDFSQQRLFAYLASFGTPQRILSTSFSFLGHYGVQIFVFLSAYGLALKYWSDEPWLQFVGGRIRKLYPMFLLAIGLWALWVGLVRGPFGPIEVLWRQGTVLLLTLTGLLNIVPWHRQLPVGPWWFMPFIMQLYCLWPFLRRIVRRFGAPGLCALSVISLGLTYALNDTLAAHWSVSILQTPIGHLPECCLGIAMARFGYRPGRVAAAVAAAVFILGNLLHQFWLLSFISGLILMIWLYLQFRPALRRCRPLAQVGGYSTAIFLVNGFVRLPFVLVAARTGLWYVRLLFGVESASMALAVALLMTVTAGMLSRARAGEPLEMGFPRPYHSPGAAAA